MTATPHPRMNAADRLMRQRRDFAFKLDRYCNAVVLYTVGADGLPDPATVRGIAADFHAAYAAFAGELSRALIAAGVPAEDAP